MTTQTKAERLADVLEKWNYATTHEGQAAAELRRLVSFNQQLMDEVERLKNALAEQQKPFTYYDPVRDAIRPFPSDGDIPLYTTPPQRKPLSVEKMFEAIRPLYNSDKAARLAVNHSKDEYRAIEAAHNIKE